VRTSAAKMKAALADIASGRSDRVGATGGNDAYMAAVRRARQGLAICRHCRTLLSDQCKTCDDYHGTACCECSGCQCSCTAEG
jgi:hypothetical protein